MTAILFSVAAVFFVIVATAAWFVRNPVWSPSGQTPPGLADAQRLETDVRALASIQPSRSMFNVQSLNQAAQYVEDGFVSAGCDPVRQSFAVGDNEYHNIICSFGPQDAPRLVIGAHYDVAGDDNPGADDNASAVAGVLELARLLNQTKPELRHRIELVAWSLEEPPTFKTKDMGSFVYAERLANDNSSIILAVALDMIGYFSDEPGSQTFPMLPLKLLYPDTANFIGVVGKSFDRHNVARVKSIMQQSSDLLVYSINAPAIVPGVDFSDHWSFWQNDLPALMVTDTAYLRNPNYHMPTDTPDTLDYGRMAKVVDGIYQVALGF